MSRNDIARKLRFAANDVQNNNLTIEQVKERYPKLLNFLDRMEEADPEMKIEVEKRARELAIELFKKKHNIE